MGFYLRRTFIALVDMKDFDLLEGDEFIIPLDYDYIAIAKDNYVKKYSKSKFYSKYKEKEHYTDIQNF